MLKEITKEEILPPVFYFKQEDLWIFYQNNTKIKPLNLSEWRVIHAFSIQKSSVLFTITYVQKHVISGFTEKT